MPVALSSIVLKIASLCNLNCSYCYIYNHEDQSYRARPKLISDEVFDATLERIEAYCEARGSHTMSIIFHGGEPTLMPLNRFEALAARARTRLGPRLRRLAMQSNAVLIDDQWAAALRRHDVSMAVSVDGPPNVHDAVRVDHAGRGSHAATMAGVRRLRSADIAPNVLCVINPGHSGVEVYRHLLAEGFRRITFLLPDVSHDNKQHLYGEHGPTPVADYLIPVFDEWFAADDPRIVLNPFWELIERVMGGLGKTDCFGNPLMNYLIVETDGSIEALDALRVCRQDLAKSGLNVLFHTFDDVRIGLPLVYKAVHEGFPLCGTCRACEFNGVCGGGYLPHRYSRANGFDNPSVWCADLTVLLKHMQASLTERSVA
jgi:uncharacterized protein